VPSLHAVDQRFSKRLEQHCAAISLYVAFYNLCRPHESLTENAANQTTPAMALKITDSISTA
jgi:hypothetical protein